MSRTKASAETETAEAELKTAAEDVSDIQTETAENPAGEAETGTENSAETVSSEKTEIAETKDGGAEEIADGTEKKMSVLQYLEAKPQPVYAAELMKKEFGMQFHTENEWDSILENLVGRKIR